MLTKRELIRLQSCVYFKKYKVTAVRSITGLKQKSKKQNQKVNFYSKPAKNDIVNKTQLFD